MTVLEFFAVWCENFASIEKLSFSHNLKISDRISFYLVGFRQFFVLFCIINLYVHGKKHCKKFKTYMPYEMLAVRSFFSFAIRIGLIKFTCTCFRAENFKETKTNCSISLKMLFIYISLVWIAFQFYRLALHWRSLFLNWQKYCSSFKFDYLKP